MDKNFNIPGPGFYWLWSSDKRDLSLLRYVHPQNQHSHGWWWGVTAGGIRFECKYATRRSSRLEWTLMGGVDV